MEKQTIKIDGIPALLWGPKADRLFIAVHGDQAHKEDAAIGVLAEEAAQRGWQALSFDLPEHGARKGQPRLCKPRECVEDLQAVMEYARALCGDISLFGCSLGAYFSMLAYKNEPLRQALFLSPVVDMRRVIQNMMGWFGVSEKRLKQEGEIATPAKTLYWDYYQYVAAHPLEWDKPTALLYGGQDTLCEYEVVSGFASRCHADMTVMEEGEHFFHTAAQLAFYRQWLRRSIAD